MLLGMVSYGPALGLVVLAPVKPEGARLLLPSELQGLNFVPSCDPSQKSCHLLSHVQLWDVHLTLLEEDLELAPLCQNQILCQFYLVY